MIKFSPASRAIVVFWSSVLALSAYSATPEDAKGLWLTAEKDAVLEFKACPDKPSSLCGHIVWEKDADKPDNTCGLQISQMDRFANDAWRDGWLYDPRDKKKFKGVLRVKDGDLHVRAFVGAEVLGQTEQMTRTQTVPDSPVCKKS